MSCYYVVISERDSERVVKELGPIQTERVAHKVMRGASINLNSNEFYIEVTEEEMMK